VTPTKLRNWLTATGFHVIAMTEPEAINLAVVAIKKA
jgi:hypothetical protein